MQADVDDIVLMVLATPLHVGLPESVLVALGHANSRGRSTQEEGLTFSSGERPISLRVLDEMRNVSSRKSLIIIYESAFAVQKLLFLGSGL